MTLRSLSLSGQLELEMPPRPLSLAGRFHIGAGEATGGPFRWLPVLIGALLAAPAAVTLAVGMLSQLFGFPAAFDAISRSTVLSAIVAFSLFVGAPIAIILVFLPVMRFRLSRDQGKLSTLITLQPTLFHLVIGGLALLVAAVFFGHLVADEFACLRGIASAC